MILLILRLDRNVDVGVDVGFVEFGVFRCVGDFFLGGEGVGEKDG